METNTSCCEKCTYCDCNNASHQILHRCTNPQCKCHQSSHSKGDEALYDAIEKCVGIAGKMKDGGVYGGSYAAPREDFRYVISKLLSDREEEVNDIAAQSALKFGETRFTEGLTAGATAERERILEKLPSLIEPMDSDLKKGAGYLAAELRSLLTPHPTKE